MAKRPRNKKIGLDKRLLAYSAAAGAALSVTASADANVICSAPKNLPVNISNSPVNIDINGDGTNDFVFSYIQNTTYRSYFTFESKGVWIRGAQTSNSALGGLVPVYTFLAAFAPYRLKQGTDISQGTSATWNSGYGILNGFKYTAAPNGTVEAPIVPRGSVPDGKFCRPEGFYRGQVSDKWKHTLRMD